MQNRSAVEDCCGVPSEMTTVGIPEAGRGFLCARICPGPGAEAFLPEDGSRRMLVRRDLIAALMVYNTVRSPSLSE